MKDDSVALLRRAAEQIPAPSTTLDDLARLRRRHRKLRAISSIAVGLCALGVTLFLVLQLLPHSGRGSIGGNRIRVVPAPYGRAPEGVGDVLDIQALTDRAAVALMAHAVISTEDAGARWNDVSPPDFEAFSSSRLVAVDPRQWYVVSLPKVKNGIVAVFRTGDRGATWERTDIHLAPKADYDANLPRGLHAQAPDMWFPDADHGVIQFPVSPFPLYVTSDGGRTWEPGPTVPGDVIGNNGPCCVVTMGFSSPTEWWAVADHEYRIPHGDVPVGYLYRSTDAGDTWERVKLPDAPIEPATDPRGPASEFDTPRFFGREGVMFAFAATSRSNKAEFAYVTHDGGRTWSATSPIRIEQGAGSPIYVADALDASTWFVYSTSGELALTTDGGKSWTARPIGGPGPPDVVSRLSFTSVEDGWALNGDGDPAEPYVLWHTSDGGETWQVVLTDHPTRQR
jgi:photosystem II stability/assembly factor-like uncharacterized protein